MRFNYKGKDYFTSSLRNEDMTVVFREHIFIVDDNLNKLKEVTREYADKNEEEVYKKGQSFITEYEFIAYFFGQYDDEEEITFAKKYIDDLEEDF